jgi:peptide deformylase
MHATMLERNGVGIAAPQVYISKRVIIVASRQIHVIPMHLKWMLW